MPLILFDFKSDGSVLIKNFAYRDKSALWRWTSDSILTVDSLNYVIKSFDETTLKLLDLNRVDTFWMYLTRPLNTKLDKTPDQISEILLSNTWTNVDSIGSNWDTHFDYLNNGCMIYRYQLPPEYAFESLDNLQVENWRVATYEKFTFMYSYRDMPFGSGSLERLNQIVQIDQDSYSLVEISRDQSSVVKYRAKKEKDLREATREIISGHWRGANSSDQSYGRYISKKALERGICSLYEGETAITITQDSIEIKIPKAPPLSYSYRLSRDGRSMILEMAINEEYINGIAFDYCDIVGYTDSTLDIRLYNNSIYTEASEPISRYLINTIQKLKRN